MPSKNGRLASSELTYVQGVTRLANVAAKSWFNMKAAAAKDGVTLTIAIGYNGSGGYRDYACQVDMPLHPVLYGLQDNAVNMATAGYSTHGEGLAFDLGSMTDAKLAWMLKNGPKYGWTRTFGTADRNHFGHDGHTTGPTLAPAGTGTTTPVTPTKEEVVAMGSAVVIKNVTGADAGKILLAAPLLYTHFFSTTPGEGTDRAHIVARALQQPNDAPLEFNETEVNWILDAFQIPLVHRAGNGHHWSALDDILFKLNQ